MIKFSTKADTLAQLEKSLTKSRVLPQFTFTMGEFRTSQDSIIERLQSTFRSSSFIVRSSAFNEDTGEASNAGKYLSLTNVTINNFPEAVNRVITSYDDDRLDQQVLVQPMLENISVCGVIFTIDPNTGGNYYVINYDISGLSDAVTSGMKSDLVTEYVFHGTKSKDDRINWLIAAAEEIIALSNTKAVDIEFAFTLSGELYILQARQLIVKTSIADYSEQKAELDRIALYIENSVKSKPNIAGKQTIFGVMPDWNPAEIIGIRPRPLALSLYKQLITDGIWAYQRDNYGYQNLRGVPLMVDFCGFPYIDTRGSFNSFIPKGLNGELINKLADYYLESLRKNPDKHDKVEFEIVFSCYTFDLPEKMSVLDSYGFSTYEKTELANALRTLTNNIINAKNGFWITDNAKIDILKNKQESVLKSDLSIIEKIYWLLEDCARYGTLPFAGLARAGFVAILLLRSLVSIGIITNEEYQSFMGELNTISSQMAFDNSELSRSAFLRKYGHLRPGTYDITTQRYDAAPELYFGETERQPFSEPKKTPFKLSVHQYEAIHNAMCEHGLDGDVLTFFQFLKIGIEAREYSKFIFTKSLSEILELFAVLGESNGFTREDMSFADCGIINRLYTSSDDSSQVIGHSIEQGQKKYSKTLSLTLPPLIMEPCDIYSFILPSGQPNYITLKTIEGDICKGSLTPESIKGKIVLINSADPGYDWIFTHNITGFVTAYGGVNSHMAIRAGELGIPAVIGAGEKLFSQLAKTEKIRIDCSSRRVEVLK